LLGHGAEMAIACEREAGAGFVIEAAGVPVLAGAASYIEAGYLTRGATRNPQHFGRHVRVAESVDPMRRTLLWEAETSGGLLLAVPAATVERFERACTENEQRAWRIGEVVSGSGIQVA
ncbi:MAG: hypothetical protein KDD91_23930, partial [Caldilinea sp.]|nr:hypothetical protein [Caldilinea sp.]